MMQGPERRARRLAGGVASAMELNVLLEGNQYGVHGVFARAVHAV